MIAHASLPRPRGAYTPPHPVLYEFYAIYTRDTYVLYGLTLILYTDSDTLHDTLHTRHTAISLLFFHFSLSHCRTFFDHPSFTPRARFQPPRSTPFTLAQMDPRISNSAFPRWQTFRKPFPPPCLTELRLTAPDPASDSRFFVSAHKYRSCVSCVHLCTSLPVHHIKIAVKYIPHSTAHTPAAGYLDNAHFHTLTQHCTSV